MVLLFFVPVKAEEFYYERIDISIRDEMKFQPVDMDVFFNEPCHALDEKKHSIRLLFNGKEIESQIYNLKHINEKEIKSCKIVFIYQGEGEYVIRYGKKIEDVNYDDHVEVTDSSYFIEPLPGYSARLNYYELKENNKPLFGICQEGKILHIDMGNKIIKVRDNADKFEMKNWVQIASFALCRRFDRQ